MGFVEIYKPDGTVVIEADSRPTYFGNWNPLRGYSTRLTIMRYAGLKDLYQRNFKFYIVENDAKWINGKEQGCRYCKQTGLMDLRCWPTSCWDTKTASDGSHFCPTHPELGHWPNTNTIYAYRNTHHYAPCEHGSKNAHTVKNGQSCHSCNGTKKRIYGARFERTLWDGAPLRIKDGNIIKTAATLLERMVADYVEPIG